MESAIKVFVCYAHEDEALRIELEKRLKVLVRQGYIDVWNDRNIGAGTEWEREIDQRLNTAEIILLLISPDFIASDYCYSIEMKRAMERNERGETRVVPVILRRTHWEDAPFGKLQVLPEDARPITLWPDRDDAFFSVEKGVREAIKEITAKPSTPSHGHQEKPLQKTDVRVDKQPVENPPTETHDRPRKPVENTPVANLTSAAPKRPPNIQLDLNTAAKTSRGQCRCPRCSQEFYCGECRIMSRVHRGVVLKNPPTGMLERQIARIRPEPLTDPKYLRERASRECPYCGYLLPYNIELVRNLNIVVIGDVYSGVSTYLTALLYEIQNRWASQNGLRFTCLTEEAEYRFSQEYTDELFLYQKVLPATQLATSPTSTEPLILIYELSSRTSPLHSPRSVNLIFHDNAGEDVAASNRLLQYAQYVLYADGIIFLADPLSMPNIQKNLPAHLQNPHLLTGRRASTVLSNIIPFIERQSGSVASSSSSKIPIAITLSKSDLLRYLSSAKQPPQVLTNPGYDYVGGIDLRDLQVIGTQVQVLLQSYGEQALLNEAIRLDNGQCFAISSTGWASDEQGRYPEVTPIRCLEPFLWILYQLGVIPDTTGQYV